MESYGAVFRKQVPFPNHRRNPDAGPYIILVCGRDGYRRGAEITKPQNAKRAIAEGLAQQPFCSIYGVAGFLSDEIKSASGIAGASYVLY